MHKQYFTASTSFFEWSIYMKITRLAFYFSVPVFNCVCLLSASTKVALLSMHRVKVTV